MVVHPADQPDRDVVVAVQLARRCAASGRCATRWRQRSGRPARSRTSARARPGRGRGVGLSIRGPRRVGVGRSAWRDRGAERGERRRVGDRPVGAVARAGRRRRRAASRRPRCGPYEETSNQRERVVHRAGRAAARGEPLGVQRRAAGEHRPHDLQARVRRPAPLPPRRARRPASRPRRTVIARPPRRRAASPAGAGPGCTNSGAPPLRQALEHRADARRARRSPASARGGQAEAGGAEVEQRVDAQRGSAAASASDPHGANGPPSSSTPAWKASSSGCASAAGRLSIPSGDDGATSTRSRPSPPATRARAAGSWRARSNARGGFAGQLELPAVATAAQARRVVARGEQPSSGSGQRCWWTSVAGSRPSLQHFVDRFGRDCGVPCPRN